MAEVKLKKTEEGYLVVGDQKSILHLKSYNDTIGTLDDLARESVDLIESVIIKGDKIRVIERDWGHEIESTFREYVYGEGTAQEPYSYITRKNKGTVTLYLTAEQMLKVFIRCKEDGIELEDIIHDYDLPYVENLDITLSEGTYTFEYEIELLEESNVLAILNFAAHQARATQKPVY